MSGMIRFCRQFKEHVCTASTTYREDAGEVLQGDHGGDDAVVAPAGESLIITCRYSTYNDNNSVRSTVLLGVLELHLVLEHPAGGSHTLRKAAGHFHAKAEGGALLLATPP